MKHRAFAGIAFLIACLAIQYAWLVPTQRATPEKPRAKNIILLIGDGMAAAQYSAGIYHSQRPMALEQFPVIGLHKTHCDDDLVTDSAAGATAFSCGIKTKKFALGMDGEMRPCKTILEEARERGMATGFVVTSSVVHATPAAFYAHQKMRYHQDNIAMDLMNADIDFIVGGGRTYFVDREIKGRSLIFDLERKGYQVSDFLLEDLDAMRVMTIRKFMYFTAHNEPLPASAGREYLPYASYLAAQFLMVRGRKNGFFLMVEGSQIDWAGHSRSAPEMVSEMLDFDKAIGEALRFARRRDDTLVLVTGDHESGGMAITQDPLSGEARLVFSVSDHTATMVPIFAYGPGAEYFSGIYDNTAIYHKMRQALGWD
jgi:alkaline phosphatase